MKKILLIAFFFLPALALAQGFVPLAPIPGLTTTQPDAGGLTSFFNNLYKYLIGLSAALAVIMIIWGGLEYATQDSISKKSDGKHRIYQALLGLALVLSPVLVFSIINPGILNLSVGFKAIDLTTPPVTTTCPTGQTGTPPNCKLPCGNGLRESGGKCVRTPPLQEGPQYDRPANYWCYPIVPIINGACGVDATGASLPCNYMCSTAQTSCISLLADELPPKGDGKGVPAGASCTQS